MMTGKEIAHEFCKTFIQVFGGQHLDGNDILWKWVGEDYIGKPAVQMKDLKIIWREDAIKTPELIDPVFYNLDGSRKTREEIKANLKIKYPYTTFAGI
jgi:hypothetical protein